MTDDPFAPDPFMDLIAGATGRLYPSPGAMQWADKLASTYGQERTEAAIRHAMKDPRVPKHEVLSAAEQLLEYATTKAELARTHDKEEEVAQAREDRSRREMEYQRSLASTSQPGRPLIEVLGDMPWLKLKSADDTD